VDSVSHNASPSRPEPEENDVVPSYPFTIKAPASLIFIATHLGVVLVVLLQDLDAELPQPQGGLQPLLGVLGVRWRTHGTQGMNSEDPLVLCLQFGL